jgi:hypothetical protein
MDCVWLMDGGPPVAAIPERGRGYVLRRLGPSGPTGPRRRAPVVPEQLEAVTVVGDHVLCIPDYDGVGEPPVPATLIPLDGGPAIAAPGLQAGAQRVAGHYYHVTEAGLVRRASPAGPDELVAGGAMAFAAAPEGLAWVEAGRVWSAPLPP